MGEPSRVEVVDRLGELVRELCCVLGVERGASTGGRMLAERGFAASLRRHLERSVSSAAAEGESGGSGIRL